MSESLGLSPEEMGISENSNLDRPTDGRPFRSSIDSNRESGYKREMVGQFNLNMAYTAEGLPNARKINWEKLQDHMVLHLKDSFSGGRIGDGIAISNIKYEPIEDNKISIPGGYSGQMIKGEGESVIAGKSVKVRVSWNSSSPEQTSRVVLMSPSN